jgi:hypothetical protein
MVLFFDGNNSLPGILPGQSFHTAILFSHYYDTIDAVQKARKIIPFKLPVHRMEAGRFEDS